jgi:hypothetical protein
MRQRIGTSGDGRTATAPGEPAGRGYRTTLPGLALSLLLLAAPAAHAGGSFLYRPAYAFDRCLRLPAEPYAPQPGDLFFAATPDVIMRLGHHLAGAADPHHSGIVFARADGSLAILEAGPFNSLVVTGWDVMEHLLAYEKTERVWVRRRKCPLTPEQGGRLTAFCTAQVGKPFATLRVGAQLTPFRTRGPIRTTYCGKVHGDRDKWFCSELVTESLAATGLIDAETARPSATYPRDLFFDRSPNRWIDEHLDLSAGWYPPARWTSAPLVPCAGPAR